MTLPRVQVLLEEIRRALLNDSRAGANVPTDSVLIGMDRPPPLTLPMPCYVVRDEKVISECGDADTLGEVISFAVDIYQRLSGGRDEALVLGGPGAKGLLQLAYEVEEIIDGNRLGGFAEVVKTGESASTPIDNDDRSFGRRTVRFDAFIYSIPRTSSA